MFLYHKAFLRPGAKPPPPDPVPQFEVQGAAPSKMTGRRHILHAQRVAAAPCRPRMHAPQAAHPRAARPARQPHTVPQLPAVGLRHPLEAAHSPLVRALPEYERQFEQQLGEARAHWETSQQRMHW